MSNRPIIFLLLFLILAALACNAPVQNPLDLLQPLPSPTPTPLPHTPTPAIETLVIVENTEYDVNTRDQYRVDAVFPFLPNGLAQAKEFNRAMSEFSRLTLEQFRAEAAQAALADAPASESFLSTRYDIFHNENGILSLRLWVSIYMKGAAHPGAFAHSFNYDLYNRKMLALDNLFQPQAAYLDSLAAICQAEIASRDAAYWPDGAAADAGNYRIWNIRNDGLLVTFNEYQVAPYAAGPQEVFIPFAHLSGLLDPGGAIGRVTP